MPIARPEKVTNAHVEPASIWPTNVKRPWQPPPSSPTARKLIWAGAGSLVIPGCWVVVPVGARAVPPHVHDCAAAAGDVTLAVAAATVASARIERSFMLPHLFEVVRAAKVRPLRGAHNRPNHPMPLLKFGRARARLTTSGRSDLRRPRHRVDRA